MLVLVDSAFINNYLPRVQKIRVSNPTFLDQVIQAT